MLDFEFYIKIMKKYILLILLLFAIQVVALSCPVCERNQPKVLKGIVHGAGPESNWDYISVVIVAIIACLTLFYSIFWLIKPGEKSLSHIKYSILK